MPIERAAAAATQKPEPVLQPLEQLFGRKRSHSCRGELNGQRDAVETLTDLDHRIEMPFGGEGPIHRTHPLAEQVDRGAGRVQRRNAMNAFTAHTQRLATCGKDLEVRAAGHQFLDERADLGDEVFAVVDHQHHFAFADPIQDRLKQHLLAARQNWQYRGHSAHDGSRVGHRCEVDEEHSLVEVVDLVVPELECRSRLSDATSARKRNQAA